jgi:hypothetical protein
MINKKIGFVLPIYKEFDTVQKAQSRIDLLKKAYPNAVIIVVADDKLSMINSHIAGAFVPYHAKKTGFGKSLCEGICLAWFTFDCHYVVLADWDHPLEAIENFLDKMNHNGTIGVLVGKEKGEWKKSRQWSNMLVQKLLFKDVTNPTCGFQVWRNSVLQQIPWDKITSNWDAVHIELLFWAKHNGAHIQENSFEEVQKARIYIFKRYISWAATFAHLLRLKYLARIST